MRALWGAAVVALALAGGCAVEDDWEGEARILTPGAYPADPMGEPAPWGDPGDPTTPAGCCTSFDCEDADSLPDPDLCGEDYTVCDAVEDCCGMNVKTCFPPDQPSECPPYSGIEASGATSWRHYFEEFNAVGPISWPYSATAWPMSTGVVGLAGALGFRAVSVVSSPALIFLDFVEASQQTINAADDGACQCLELQALRGRVWSQVDSPHEEVYCWRPSNDPADPFAKTCQTEYGYSECVYEDALTGIGKDAVIHQYQMVCDCGINPSNCTSIPEDDGAHTYCCDEGLNACNCKPPGTIAPTFVTCSDTANLACQKECSPSAVDCRERDDILACPEVAFTPYG